MKNNEAKMNETVRAKYDKIAAVRAFSINAKPMLIPFNIKIYTSLFAAVLSRKGTFDFPVIEQNLRFVKVG